MALVACAPPWAPITPSAVLLASLNSSLRSFGRCVFSQISGTFNQLGYWCRPVSDGDHLCISSSTPNIPSGIYLSGFLDFFFRNVVWNVVFWFEGYPGGYPATTPTYTPNLYQTGSPGYPPGEHHHPHLISCCWLFNHVIGWRWVTMAFLTLPFYAELSSLCVIL